MSTNPTNQPPEKRHVHQPTTEQVLGPATPEVSQIEGLQPKGDTPQKLDAGTIEFQDVFLGFKR